MVLIYYGDLTFNCYLISIYYLRKTFFPWEIFYIFNR